MIIITIKLLAVSMSVPAFHKDFTWGKRRQYQDITE